MRMSVDIARQRHHPVVHSGRNFFIEEHLIECERNVLAPSAHNVVEQLLLDEILISRSQAAARLFQRIALRLSRERPSQIAVFLRPVMRCPLVMLVREREPIDSAGRVCLVLPKGGAPRPPPPFPPRPFPNVPEPEGGG